MGEPTTGIDPKNVQLLWSVIRAARKNSTVLLVSHSLVEAEALADRVGIFINGQLRSIGSPAELKARLGKYYKVAFVAATDEDEHKLHVELACGTFARLSIGKVGF